MNYRDIRDELININEEIIGMLRWNTFSCEIIKMQMRAYHLQKILDGQGKVSHPFISV